MSKVSSIYDAIVTRVGTVLPNHRRLPNPYQIESNTEPSLKQGWGIQIGPGNNPELLVSCQRSIDRDFVIVITRKFYGSDLNILDKASTEKDLMEDSILVINDFEKHPLIQDYAAKAIWSSDQGIQFVFVPDKPFFKIEMTMTVTYFENNT